MKKTFQLKQFNSTHCRSKLQFFSFFLPSSSSSQFSMFQLSFQFFPILTSFPERNVRNPSKAISIQFKFEITFFCFCYCCFFITRIYFHFYKGKCLLHHFIRRIHGVKRELQRYDKIILQRRQKNGDQQTNKMLF